MPIETPQPNTTSVSETPKLSVGDAVWQQVVTALDYPVYDLSAMRDRFMEVSDDPGALLFYREDARKNAAKLDEAELHLVNALQILKQTIPIIAAKYETNAAQEPEALLDVRPSVKPSVLVN